MLGLIRNWGYATTTAIREGIEKANRSAWGAETLAREQRFSVAWRISDGCFELIADFRQIYAWFGKIFYGRPPC